MQHFQNVDGNTNPTIRLYYENDHYNIVRADGVGFQLFNFEGLEKGELESYLSSSKKPNNKSESEVNFSSDDQKLAHAIKLSLDEKKAEEKYLRFYASRIIKLNSNQQIQSAIVYKNNEAYLKPADK